MASRLSEQSLPEVYDAGHEWLSWGSKPSEPFAFQKIDLDQILLQEDAEKIIQDLPVQPLYQALVAKGLDECLEVLPLISDEQLTRIFDYEGWRRDRLVAEQVFRWLELYREISPKQLYQRFRSLEEEYQLAILGPYLEVIDSESHERLIDAEQDTYTAFPGNEIFFRIRAESRSLGSGIEALLQAAMGEDMEYAISLVSHAAYIPPNEQEQQLLQFRTARLEEDGFVSFEDSLKIYLPEEPLTLKQKWASVEGFSPKSSEALVAKDSSEGKDFLDLAMAWGLNHGWSSEEALYIQRSIVHLANGLCAVAQVEPDNLTGLKRILEQARGIIATSLEYLSSGKVEVASLILKSEHPNLIFRSGLGLIYKVQKALIEALETVQILEGDSLRKAFEQRRPGIVLNLIDRQLLSVLGFERTELLKGIFNRFPMVADKIAEGKDHQRMHFKALAGLKDFALMVDKADALAGLLFMVRKANIKHLPVKDIDRVLQTALAHAYLGGAFAYEPLTNEQLEKLLSLDGAQIQALGQDLLEEASEALAGQTWWSMRYAVEGVSQDVAVQPVAQQLSDLILGLRMALEDACAQGKTRLTAILDTQD